MRVFSVQDIKAGAFHPPFIAPTEGVAMRMMSDCIARDGHPYHAHPADYTLYEIGAFDEVTGAILAAELRCIASLANMEG